MIDFLSLDISYLKIDYLLNHPLLKPLYGNNIGTGEQVPIEHYPTKLKPKYVVKYRTINFEIYGYEDPCFKKIRFSPIKYSRYGVYLFSPFTKIDYCLFLKDLKEKFTIDPFTITLHTIDTCFDILLPDRYCVSKVIKNVLFHESRNAKCKNFEYHSFPNGGMQTKLKRGTFNLKIYHKGYEVGEPERKIMRMECQTYKMVQLKKRLGIRSKHMFLIDVATHWDEIKDYTIEKLKDCFVFDYLLRDPLLSHSDDNFYLRYSSQEYWLGLNRDDRREEIAKYNMKCSEMGLNLNSWIKSVLY